MLGNKDSSLFFKCCSSVIESALAKLQEMEERVAAAPPKGCDLGWNFLQFCECTFNYRMFRFKRV